MITEPCIAGKRMVWLGTLLTVAACLMLGHLIEWQRGLYLDDFNFHHRIRLGKKPVLEVLQYEVCGDHAWPQARGLGFGLMMLTLGAYPEGEWGIRFFQAGLAGLNALLLAWLSWRLLRSPLAAWVTGLTFLLPTAAHEACLWTCCVDYLLGTALALGALHAGWHFLFGKTRPWLGAIIAAVCLVLSLMMKESFLAIYVLMPAVLFLGWRQSDRKLSLKDWARRTLLCLAPAALLSLGFLVINYIIYPPVALTGRGGTVSSGAELWQKTQSMFDTLQYYWPGSGTAPGGFSAWDTGLKVLGESAPAQFCLALALLGVVLAAWKWPASPSSTSGSPVLAVMALGASWFVLALLFPNALVKQQEVTSRMLYFPCTGLALLAGSAAAAVARKSRLALVERSLVLGAGIIGVLLALEMLGYAHHYAARFQEDQRQWQELKRTIPASTLPPGTLLVHVQSPRYALKWHPLIGLLDAQYALQHRAERHWGRGDLQWQVLSQWETEQGLPWRWAGPDTVLIGGRRVPLTHVVVFFYETDTGIWVLTHLTLPDEYGQIQRRALPAVAARRR
jgi:hypothetical protein